MSYKIGVVDLKTGNLTSLTNRLYKVSTELGGIAISTIHSTPSQSNDYDGIILPGVGSFAYFSKAIDLVPNLRQYIVQFAKERPVLGICLGMQFLFTNGYEGSLNKGLGLIDGEVNKIITTNPKIKIPHMGWNDIQTERHNQISKDIKDGLDFYFVHSYMAFPKNENDIVAYADYHGIKIPCIVAKQNTYGVQFHPEKSGKNGEIILKNFINICTTK